MTAISLFHYYEKAFIYTNMSIIGKTSRKHHYELDPAKLIPAPELSWQAPLKKIKVKLDLLTDIDMLLMVEKGTREGICHAIQRYAKPNNKFMKDYDKSKESSYLKH